MKFLILAATMIAVIASQPSEAQFEGDHCVDGHFAISSLRIGNPVAAFRERFGTYCQGGDIFTGQAISEPFILEPNLIIGVSGYPNLEGMELSLLNDSNGDRIPIQLSDVPRERYLPVGLPVPQGWTGTSTRIFISDQNTGPGGWVSVTMPFNAGSNFAATKITFWYLSTLVFYSAFFFFLRNIYRRRLSEFQSEASAVASIALFAYVVFWSSVYWASASNLAFYLVLLTITFYYTPNGLKFITNHHRQKIIKPIRISQSMCLFTLISVYGIINIGLSSVYGISTSPFFMQDAFFESLRPHDNWLPVLLFDRIVNSGDLALPADGGWAWSERGPVQASLYLVIRPFIEIGGTFAAQGAGVLFQIFALFSIWRLCFHLNLGSRITLVALIGSLSTPFFLYNIVYVWPKLLAAGLTIWSAIPLLKAVSTGKPLGWINALLSSLIAGFAVLAHGGAIYFLLALGILLMLRVGRELHLFKIPAMVFIAIFTLLSWSPFELLSPSQNRLIHDHFTDRTRDTANNPFGSVINSHSDRTLGSWLADRSANVRTIAGSEEFDRQIGDTLSVTDPAAFSARTEARFRSSSSVMGYDLLSHNYRSLVTMVRIDQREHVLRSVGILVIGLPLWIIFCFPGNSENSRAYRATLSLALISVGIWSVIQFWPGSTVITHASYALIITIILGLAVSLYEFSERLFLIVSSLNSLLTLGVWYLGFTSIARLEGMREIGIEPFLNFDAIVIGVMALIVTLCVTALAWNRFHLDRSEVIGEVKF